MQGGGCLATCPLAVASSVHGRVGAMQKAWDVLLPSQLTSPLPCRRELAEALARAGFEGPKSGRHSYTACHRIEAYLKANLHSWLQPCTPLAWLYNCELQAQIVRLLNTFTRIVCRLCAHCCESRPASSLRRMQGQPGPQGLCTVRSPFLSVPLLPFLQRGEGNAAAIVDGIKKDKEEAESREKRRSDLLKK